MNWGTEVSRKPAEGMLEAHRYARGPGYFFYLFDEVTYTEVVDGVQRIWIQHERSTTLHTIPTTGLKNWGRLIGDHQLALNALGTLMELPSLIARNMSEEENPLIGEKREDKS